MVARADRNVRIDLGYHGRWFHGSQRQPGVRTVQGELEGALEQVTRQECRLVFAGRTDQGVHAVGQTASGRVRWFKDLERLRFGLDALTGDDLRIYRVSAVSDAFHARYGARRREYRYRIWNSMRPPVLVAGSVWWVREPLDLVALNRSSQRLIGKRDFRSFTGKGFGRHDSARSSVRTIERCEWRTLRTDLEPSGQLVEMQIAADAFLPHMVRNIVGALIEIGSGRRSFEWLDTLVERRERREAPPPAPPSGLVLWQVDYDEQGTDEGPAGRVPREQE